MVAFGPTVVPAPMTAAGSTLAVGWIDDAVALERHHQRGFGDHLIVDQRLAGDAGDRAALGDQPHRQADPVAGHDLAAELDAVDAAQRGPRLERLAVAVEQQDRRGLGQRLEHQHARHHRLAREMALEEVFADRHALHRLERAAALVRDDGVHEGHRVAIGQPVERERGDGGHWDARTGGEGCAERRPAGTGARPGGPRERGPPGCEGYFFGVAAAAAASSFLMMSVVMSRPGSAQTTPESMLLKTMCRPLAADTSESTGRSLRWNSSCSSFCRSSTAFWASWVARWRSVCSRSTSFCCVRPDRLAQHRGAGLEPLAGLLELRVARDEVLFLLLAERRQTLGRGLALGRLRGDALDVHVGDLGAFRERTRRRRSGGGLAAAGGVCAAGAPAAGAGLGAAGV